MVVDASVALAWCLPDEHSIYAESLLVEIENAIALVPPIWAVEVANSLAVAIRRKRIHTGQYEEALKLLQGINVVESALPWRECVERTVALADAYRLSAYDAAYLELALRADVPLATLDPELVRAARRAGVVVAGQA